MHGHLLAAAAAWQQGHCYDAVLHLRCAADCACDHLAERRSIDLYRAAAELSSTLPQSPPDSQIRQRKPEPTSALPSVWVRALGELPLAVRLRIAVDVLSQLLDGGVRAVLARTPSSRLHFDNVRVDVEGRAHILDAGSHSGVGLLLWEILAGSFADSDAPPPLRQMRDDVPVELDALATRTLDNDPSCARVDQLLGALELFCGTYPASHEDVRSACGIARDDEPTHPGPPLSEWDFGDDGLGSSGIRCNGNGPVIPGLAGRHAVPRAVMARLDAIHGSPTTPYRIADGETAETAVQDMAPILEAAGFVTPVPPPPSDQDVGGHDVAAAPDDLVPDMAFEPAEPSPPRHQVTQPPPASQPPPLATPLPARPHRSRMARVALVGAGLTAAALLLLPFVLRSSGSSSDPTAMTRARVLEPVIRTRPAIRELLADPPRSDRNRRPK